MDNQIVTFTIENMNEEALKCIIADLKKFNLNYSMVGLYPKNNNQPMPNNPSDLTSTTS